MQRAGDVYAIRWLSRCGRGRCWVVASSRLVTRRCTRSIHVLNDCGSSIDDGEPADRGHVPIECRRMAILVRTLRPGEERRYLEIVNSAIQGLASSHYPPSAIAGWIVPETDDQVRDLIANVDREIRLIAELDGVPVGIGALVVERSELRACYVSPGAARRGCGRLLVEEIERIARARGLTRLDVASSLNAEPFYARLDITRGTNTTSSFATGIASRPC